jgi:hypothetical protein
MLTRADIIREARSYVGTLMCHRGRLRTGVDCIGLVHCVGTTFGLVDRDAADYGVVPPSGRIVDELRNSKFVEIDPQCAQPGDIVCFWLLDPTKVIHCGFLTDLRGSGLVHVYGSPGKGKVVEHGYKGTVWERRAAAAFSFPEVEPWQQ